VPNFDMMIEKGLFSEFISDHLYYFTKETLVATLSRNGFQVIGCDVIWHDYILSAVVRKRPPLDLSSFAGFRDGLAQQLNAYLARFGDRRVAVWGAGHQALAVLALAGLGGRVRYVVDSAPFKQGRFTPATHLPIVAPAILASDPPDAVIIMAGSYSDEVAAQLRRNFAKDIQLAILREYSLEELPVC
jgi:hypothetical protein